MINTFKKNPTLDPKRGHRRVSDPPAKHSHESHHHIDDNKDESEQERESRQYTNFSMYHTVEEVDVKKGVDIIQFERSDSSTKSKKQLFQNSVQRVMKLQALVQKLKSFNSKLVKATLIEMMPLINNPETAVILKDAGLCSLLLDLLKFDPLSHWSIVGLSLQALLSVVIIPECALTAMSLPTFYETIENFLKSDKALTQKIAGRIVYRCFTQPIQHEWIVLQDKNMLNLLFIAMELPYKDVQMNILSLLEDLTYHCDNTLQLCAYSEKVEVDFIRMIVDIVLAEGNNDIRLLAMKVYLNALSAIQFDRRIARAVILHALPVETSLMKHMKSLQRSKMRKTSALLSTSRNSKLCLLDNDVAPDNERAPMMPARRSSMFGLKSQKYGDMLEEDRSKEGGAGGGGGGGTLRSRNSGRTSVREGGQEGAAAGALLQVTEEIGVIVEILWLIRSSVMFQRLVKHTKRTNLVEPTNSISQLYAVA